VQFMKKIVLTGAAGRIGSVVRAHFAAARQPLLISDIRPCLAVTPGETERVGDLCDAAFTRNLLSGVDTVIHMAGIPDDRPLAELIGPNFLALNTLYTAAQEMGVRRVVFASSNHATGMYPAGQIIDTQVAVKPDSDYGAAKVWGEALGRMFWDKHGLETICLRIGSFTERPVSVRHLSTWLSHRDLCALLEVCIEAPRLGFEIIYGVSANTRSWWDNRHSRLPYRPLDNAEDYAERIAREAPPADPLEARFQGGDFAARYFNRADERANESGLADNLT